MDPFASLKGILGCLSIAALRVDKTGTKASWRTDDKSEICNFVGYLRWKFTVFSRLLTRISKSTRFTQLSEKRRVPFLWPPSFRFRQRLNESRSAVRSQVCRRLCHAARVQLRQISTLGDQYRVLPCGLILKVSA